MPGLSESLSSAVAGGMSEGLAADDGRERVEELEVVPRSGSRVFHAPVRRVGLERSAPIDVLFGVMGGGCGLADGCADMEVVGELATLLGIELASGHVQQSWVRGNDVVLHVVLRLKVPPGLASIAVAQLRKRVESLRLATSRRGGVQTGLPHCRVVGFGRSVNAIWGAFASILFDDGRRRSHWEQVELLRRRKREEEVRAREVLRAACVGLERLVRAVLCVQRAWRLKLAVCAVESVRFVSAVEAVPAAMRVSDAACCGIAVTGASRRRGCGRRGGRRHRRGSGSAATVVGVAVRLARGGGRQRRRRRAICAKWAAYTGGPRAVDRTDANVATLRFAMSAIARGIRVERPDGDSGCGCVWATGVLL